MKSYLVGKWLIRDCLGCFFLLWLSLETDLLPKEAYPPSPCPVLIWASYFLRRGNSPSN